MTLRIPAIVLIHVWSRDFYDMTLSTGKQRRHMIKLYNKSGSTCYAAFTSYVPGSHVSDNPDQNGINVRQRRGTG